MAEVIANQIKKDLVAIKPKQLQESKWEHVSAVLQHQGVHP